MIRGRSRLAVTAVLVGVLAALAPAAPVAADPAGPTDYRSELLGLDPETSAVDIRFVGGDAFVELVVEPGHEVEVSGYQGEPFIRVDADGTVHEDRATPTWAASQDRYAEVDIPPPGAPPDWHEVASAGRYAWHDHRAHWMGRSAPPGSAPGDQILEAVIPLTVDGVAVDATVASFRVAGPSPWSWLAVALAGAAAGVLGVLAVRRGRLPLLVGAQAALALGLGVVAVRSVPPETGPSPSLWVPAALALGSALAATALGRSVSHGRSLVGHALLGLAGVELVLWAGIRRDALVRAIIPTDAPAVLDRAVITSTLVVGAVAAVVSLVRLATLVIAPAVEDPATA